MMEPQPDRLFVNLRRLFANNVQICKFDSLAITSLDQENNCAQKELLRFPQREPRSQDVCAKHTELIAHWVWVYHKASCGKSPCMFRWASQSQLNKRWKTQVLPKISDCGFRHDQAQGKMQQKGFLTHIWIPFVAPLSNWDNSSGKEPGFHTFSI